MAMCAKTDRSVSVSRQGPAAKHTACPRIQVTVIDETHAWVLELAQAVRQPDGGFVATTVVRNDLRASGTNPRGHGIRGYGGPAIAGVIRVGELRSGIPHALAIAVSPKALNRLAPGGRSFVWPASSADASNDSTYATTGNLHMGSLLAIPPEVDLGQAGLRSEAGMQIVRALQDYGAYICDSGDCNLTLVAEPAAAAEVAGLDHKDLGWLAGHLRLVANNSPLAPGGGGHPRRPPAPPLRPVMEQGAP